MGEIDPKTKLELLKQVWPGATLTGDWTLDKLAIHKELIEETNSATAEAEERVQSGRDRLCANMSSKDLKMMFETSSEMTLETLPEEQRTKLREMIRNEHWISLASQGVRLLGSNLVVTFVSKVSYDSSIFEGIAEEWERMSGFNTEVHRVPNQSHGKQARQRRPKGKP